MQRGFYFNQTRCTGCCTCIVACKDWHDVPAGPASWIRVVTTEKGKYPDLFVSSLFLPCFHCAEPLCLKACPVNAITKREEDGVVTVNRETCIGGEQCKFACRKACPYHVPQFGAESNPRMQKCDFCLDRWAEGKQPICVAGCPTRALDAGTLGELKGKYGQTQKADGFVYSRKVKPSVIFKPKLEERGLVVQRRDVHPITCTL